MLVAVIGTWVALVAVGWALVYWPHLPEKFLFSVGLDPSDNAGFVDALPLTLPYLLHLVERVNGNEFPPEVRLRAKVLGGTISDFSNRVASKAFLDHSGASTKEILEAYARDHLYEPPEDACSS